MTLFEAMKESTVRILENAELELVSISEGQKKNEDTGEVTPFKRYEVEVEKGYEDFSRCRFTVKIENGKTIITEKEMREAYYQIKFSDLEISYISERGIVYFRASNATVKKEEN